MGKPKPFDWQSVLHRILLASNVTKKRSNKRTTSHNNISITSAYQQHRPQNPSVSTPWLYPRNTGVDEVCLILVRSHFTVFTELVASSALEPSYYISIISTLAMSNDGSPIASHNELDILNASTTTKSVIAVASLTVPPRNCTGLSPAPATVGIKPEMRTNVLPVNYPTALLQTAALLLTPLNTGMPNTGPSTRTSPLIKRAAPVTQRTLRYLSREQRREVKEEISSRLIDSDSVRSTGPGSISYTHHLDKISPAKIRPSERVPQRATDCHGQYSVRHSPLPREPPSSIVYPRAAPVTQRALRYLRREQ